MWEVAGMMGHSSGYKTTERYAKYGPDYLSGAVKALDAFFVELWAALHGREPDVFRVRASCVPVKKNPGAKPRGLLVEPSGIEPLTSTMPL